MATISFRWELNESELREFTLGSTGPIVRDLERRATAVVNGAKRRCPVNTGRLRASITKEVIIDSNSPVARVGTNVEYAIFVHNGTGIYGPRGTPIVPRVSRFLVFTPRGSSDKVFARQVRGIRPRPFLKEALEDAR